MKPMNTRLAYLAKRKLYCMKHLSVPDCEEPQEAVNAASDYKSHHHIEPQVWKALRSLPDPSRVLGRLLGGRTLGALSRLHSLVFMIIYD